MNVTVTASRNVFDEALEASQSAGYEAETTDLNTLADATLLGRLDEAWDAIETALRKGYEFGREKAESAINSAIETTNRLLEEAAGNVRNVLHDELLQRLQACVHRFVTSAIALLPTTLTIGNQAYAIERLTYTQKVLATGSIKVSIMEVTSLASNRKLTVAVENAVSS
jgi:hypothetical protein